jgi:imidazolonepropionase-like amidohydrolase
VEHGSFGDEDTYALMAEKGTFLVPTVCVHSALAGDQTAFDNLLPHIRARYIECEEVHLKNTKLAQDIGVSIAMGTDAGTPGNHHGDNMQEIERMVTGAGLTPRQAIESATMGGARLLRRENDLGSLEAGKFGDVVGFASNPLEDIHAIRNVALVVKGGETMRNDLKG